MKRALVFLAFLFLISSHCLPQAWCPKPSGVATRECSFQSLAPLREIIEARLAPNQSYLILAAIPPEIQETAQFNSFARDAFVQRCKDDPSMKDYIVKLQKSMGEQGFPATEDEIARKLYDEKLSKPDPDLGLFYAYSNRPEVTKGVSDIATETGLTLESHSSQLKEMLDPKNFQQYQPVFWGKFKKADADVIVAVGFDVSPELSKGTDKEILRISDWKAATDADSNLYDLMDVPPGQAVVLNLFPTNDEQIKPWQFQLHDAAAYVANGKKFQSEYVKLGYQVTNPKNNSPQEVLEVIRKAITVGKKVLLIAESSTMSDGSLLVRLPGSAEGLTASDWNSLGPDALKNVLAVTCHSQNLSPQMPLTLVGTIYTDKAHGLIRRTFAGGEADTVSDFMEMDFTSKKGWTAATGRIASNFTKAHASVEESATGSPTSEYTKVASIYRFTYSSPPPPASLTTTNSAPAPPANSDASTPLIPLPSPSAMSLFGMGIFGASCREGVRWKNLYQRGKLPAYVRLPYILISILLVIAAGGVALLFASVVPALLGNWLLIVAFTAGAGFEKLVKMATDLKIWNPAKAIPVPMGKDIPPAAFMLGTYESIAPEKASFVKSLRVFFRDGSS